MRRVDRPPRIDWKAKVEEFGFLFHTDGQNPYWFESACYEISSREVETLEKATTELAKICLEAVDFVIAHDRWNDLGIPSWVVPTIKSAWNVDPPAVYGRFDLAFDGTSVKLLEYNADTPTSLLEAAVIQWHWLQDVEPGADQFNSIWEALVAKWKALKEESGALNSTKVYFSCGDAVEDVMTVTVLADTAQEAGLQPVQIWLKDVGWDAVKRRFVDLEEAPIDVMFKLHPWEQMVEEPFGAQAIQTYGATQWIEPVWKMVLSNKAILAILWEMYPGHPNLLPAYLDGPRDMRDYVKKPKLSREGANVTVVQAGQTLEQTEGDYGDGPFVYQALATLPIFGGQRPVIGSWVVDQEPCGIGIRETKTWVTTDFAQFVPHLIRG